jgi:hypothetical protein
MDTPLLRLLIQGKIADGRLPHAPMPSMWGGPGNGETCDGCGEIVSLAQLIIDGLSMRGDVVRFHVPCFHVWDVECELIGSELPLRRGPGPLNPGRPAPRSG